MPDRCVAANCSSVRSCKVALFRWPTRKRQADAWRRFVETRRRSWKPSSASRFSSLHFIHSSFMNYNQFKLGKRNRLRMVPGAVPTVHSNGVGSSSAHHLYVRNFHPSSCVQQPTCVQNFHRTARVGRINNDLPCCHRPLDLNDKSPTRPLRDVSNTSCKSQQDSNAFVDLLSQDTLKT